MVWILSATTIGTQVSWATVPALRAFLSILFGTSGASKAFSFSGFVRTVRSYRLLPNSLAEVLATLIIATELALPCFLVSGYYVRYALVGAGLMLVIFSVAIGINLIRRRTDLDCGCFGSTKSRIHWGLVLRNVLIVAVICASVGLAAEFENRLGLGVAEFCGSICFILFLLFTLLNDLVSTKASDSMPRSWG